MTLNHLLSPSADGLVLGRSPDGSPGSGIQSPADIVTALNRQFPFDKERNQFFTLVYGIYDKEDQVFRFVSAGHPPLIHVTRSGETRLNSDGGVPIGILPDSEYEETSIRLEVGDRVYLYSDGLVETFGPDQEPFGQERLRQALVEARGETVAASVQAVIGKVEAWGNSPFEDDVSILAFEVTAS